MSGAGRRAIGLLAVLAGVCIVEVASGQARSSARIPSGALRVQVEPGIVIALDEDLAFEVVPRRGEGLLALAKRVCGDRSRDDQIASANGGSLRLLAGVRYRVPFDCARESLRERGMAALFPGDRAVPGGWLHQVGDGEDREETLWRIALWFTGSGHAHPEVRAANSLADETIEQGQIVQIPRHLLRPVFAQLLPPSFVAVSSGSPSRASRAILPSIVTGSASSDLDFGRDRSGDFASYRLKAGEALYSSVVVRFTGRLLAQDVNPLAQEIANRSGISDLTDIPVGYQIKIPLEYLSHQFLPADDPRRKEYEDERSAAAQYTNSVRSADLRGVTVILDAGHGGKDVGASKGGIWESVYAYDIMERVKRHLQQRTAAEVSTTTRDGTSEYRIPSRDVLPNSRAHRVLTSPPYPNEDSKVSANLRWALSNSMFRGQRKSGSSESNVIFVSIHADSLHPSVRGAMAYLPGLLPLNSKRLTSEVYRKRKEVREQNTVKFSQQERVKSLGLSRDLAENVISVLRRQGIAIHHNQPIRDRIIRGGRPWVPAVLKHSQVPAKILVEVCNLSNAEDLRLIKTQEFREKFASALVDGILSYYESGDGGRATAGG